jgi:uncharacterized membrane protein
MKTKLKNLWEHLHTSFWFLPSLMALAAVLLSWGALITDKYLLQEESLPEWLLYKSDLEGAQTILSTIAGSMITVAGVTFSITIVALTLACSQLGPRLLRNFMRDIRNQVVLGTFIAAYLYCLLILHNIDQSDNDAFVPHLSLMLALVWAVAGLGVLIYFIHHISVSIQADQAIALVSKDMEIVFKKRGSHKHESFQRTSLANCDTSYETGTNSYPFCIQKSRYIEDIDIEGIFHFAETIDGVIRINQRPGDYITPKKPLLTIYTKNDLDADKIQSLKPCFIFYDERASDEDIEFAFKQLVEIALRALSPGINDPFTAIACIDRLATALIMFIQNEKLPCICNRQGKLRIIEDMVTFKGAADTAFNQIRQTASGKPAIVIRMLERIADVLLNAETQTHKEVLLDHAAVIKDDALRANNQQRDVRDIEEYYKNILDLVNS